MTIRHVTYYICVEAYLRLGCIWLVTKGYSFVSFRLLSGVNSYHTMSNLVVANWPVKFVLFSLKILQIVDTFLPWDYILEYSIRLFNGTTGRTATTALVASSINEDQLRDQRISMVTLKMIKEHIKILHEFEQGQLSNPNWWALIFNQLCGSIRLEI